MKLPLRTRNAIYVIGGLLLVIGAALPIFLPAARFAVAPFVYTPGAIAFVAMQALDRTGQDDVTVRRLRRQQMFGGTLLLLTAVLMFTHAYHVRPFEADLWKLTLAIGALFDLYPALRLPAAGDSHEAAD